MNDDRFPGFPIPRENWSKLPHVFIEALPTIKTVGELKCILYILRHTWGFQDKDKKITVDEFMHGRKRRNRTRLDGGTGLSKTTVLVGLRQAEAHGFIMVEVDDNDKGRIKKYYSLKMQGTTPGVQKLYPCGRETIPRTEKETLERNGDDDGRQAATSSPLDLEGDQFTSYCCLRCDRIGMDSDAAMDYAQSHDFETVRNWCIVADARVGPGAGDVHNPAGFVRSKLDNGTAKPRVGTRQVQEFMEWVEDYRLYRLPEETRA